MNDDLTLPITPTSDFTATRRYRRSVGMPTSHAGLKAFFLSVINDPIYKTNFLKAARERKLAPAVETMMYAYAIGKPVEKIDLSTNQNVADLEGMTEEQLAEEAEVLALALREAKAANDAELE